MSNCDGTGLSSARHGTPARIACTAVAGVIALGCTGDEPVQVTAAVQPSVLVAQTPLDGATVAKYVTALTTLGDGARVDGTRAINVDMVEFQQGILPSSIYANRVDGQAAHFPAATIEARQNTATRVRYANRLQGAGGGPPFLQKYLTQDLTVHWADPDHVTRNNNCTNATVLAPPWSSS